jgi:hypothetical protein
MILNAWKNLPYKVKILTIVDILQLLIFIIIRYFVYEKKISEDISINTFEKKADTLVKRIDTVNKL